MRILAIDDDPLIRGLLQTGFEEEGHQVVGCDTAESGLREAQSGEFDLLIVDIGLPGMSGLDLLSRLRESGDARPVIFLTAQGSETEIVQGLELGADGYVTKPFSLGELKARVRALMRTRATARKGEICFGDLEFDPLSLTVSRSGERIRLTGTEFKILKVLVDAEGRVVPRERLLEKAFGIRFNPGTSTLDSHLSRLRKKLRAAGPPLIEAVKGEGWRAVKPVS